MLWISFGCPSYAFDASDAFDISWSLCCFFYPPVSSCPILTTGQLTSSGRIRPIIRHRTERETDCEIFCAYPGPLKNTRIVRLVFRQSSSTPAAYPSVRATPANSPPQPGPAPELGQTCCRPLDETRCTRCVLRQFGVPPATFTHALSGPERPSEHPCPPLHCILRCACYQSLLSVGHFVSKPRAGDNQLLRPPENPSFAIRYSISSIFSSCCHSKPRSVVCGFASFSFIGFLAIRNGTPEPPAQSPHRLVSFFFFSFLFNVQCSMITGVLHLSILSHYSPAQRTSARCSTTRSRTYAFIVVSHYLHSCCLLRTKRPYHSHPPAPSTRTTLSSSTYFSSAFAPFPPLEGKKASLLFLSSPPSLSPFSPFPQPTKLWPLVLDFFPSCIFSFVTSTPIHIDQRHSLLFLLFSPVFRFSGICYRHVLLLLSIYPLHIRAGSHGSFIR